MSNHPRQAPDPQPVPAAAANVGLVDRFRDHAERLLPSAGTPIVVAVSGGADSFALLDLCVEVGSWPVHVFHLDHGLRGSRAGDEDLARVAERVAVYEQRDEGPEVILHHARSDITDLARTWNLGIEEAGRKRRYDLLAELAAEVGSPAVVTAHHRDDQVETILANLLRGAGPVGRLGMPARRHLGRGIDLLRPLLRFSHRALCAYLASRQLDWFEDPTNRDPRFARNRLRHEVLPTLEAGAPGFAEALLADLEAQQARLEVELAQARDRFADRRDGDRIDLAGIGEYPDHDRYLLWRVVCHELGLPVGRGALRRIDDLARGRAGRGFALGDLLLRRRGHVLEWEPADAGPCLETVPLPAEGAVERGSERLYVRQVQPPIDLHARPLEAFLDHQRINGDLIWRCAREGERWQPFGAEGTKSVFRYLAEHGVPKRRRRTASVVADDEGVVWIPGHTIADRLQVTGATSIIRRLEVERV